MVVSKILCIFALEIRKGKGQARRPTNNPLFRRDNLPILFTTHTQHKHKIKMKKIQYSVVMLGNPLHEDDPKKAYAVLQQTGGIDIDELAEHITGHNSVFSRGTIVGVLTEMCDCIRELLLQGYSIELGDLGRFSLSVNNEAADSIEEFTSNNIKAVNVNFNAGTRLQNLRRDAQFEQTTSRAAQAAALKAAKEGKTVADWTPKQGGSDSGGGGSEPEPEP